MTTLWAWSWLVINKKIFINKQGERVYFFNKAWMLPSYPNLNMNKTWIHCVLFVKDVMRP